jgi:hypothetical protein
VIVITAAIVIAVMTIWLATRRLGVCQRLEAAGDGVALKHRRFDGATREGGEETFGYGVHDVPPCWVCFPSLFEHFVVFVPSDLMKEEEKRLRLGWVCECVSGSEWW